MVPRSGNLLYSTDARNDIKKSLRQFKEYINAKPFTHQYFSLYKWLDIIKKNTTVIEACLCR